METGVLECNRKAPWCAEESTRGVVIYRAHCSATMYHNLRDIQRITAILLHCMSYESRSNVARKTLRCINVPWVVAHWGSPSHPRFSTLPDFSFYLNPHKPTDFVMVEWLLLAESGDECGMMLKWWDFTELYPELSWGEIYEQRSTRHKRHGTLL